MRFGLLGTLEVVDDLGSSVDVGGAQPRAVLAILLVAGGRLVTADSIIDTLWGDEPPPSAAGTLQSYVSRLRRSLEPARGRGEQAKLLLWEPPGYRLAVEPEDVDFRRFEMLADEGRSLLSVGRAEEARRVLLDADALWRGPALLEYRDQEFAVGLAARLEDHRLEAIENRISADLVLGNHSAVIGELSELVAAYPLREGLRARLALALYRAGRQAEALRALADARRFLRDELGVEPGHALRDLESAILAQDPSLDLPPRNVPPANSAPPASAAPPLADQLVGRHVELTQLFAALEEARRATRVVIVEGEPGIGKTRLAEELGSEAARRGALVLWGRTFEGGAAPALWPWLPPLRALVAAAPGGAEVAPELENLLSPAAGDGGVRSGADQARFALVEAVASLLAASAAVRPIVLVLDDLQWADVESLELLTSVVSRLADAPVLVAVTVRELEVGRNDAVVVALAALTRRPGTRRLRLSGLNSSDTAALVAQATGAAVTPAAAASIYDRAEGNPFFTTELARLVASGGDLPAADVPSGVRDVVRRRLAALPDETAQLLQVGAVIGRDMDLELLARASGRELDRCLDEIEPAVVHRLLVAAPEQPGSYRFAHALVREVVVDDLSPLKRARLHLRVADALEAAGRHTDDTVEILAEHLWQAVPVGVTRRAAAALERAAGVAVRRLAYTTAQDLLERAVQLRRSAGSEPADLEAELGAVAMLVGVVGTRHGYPALTGSPLVARGKQLAEQVGRTLELLNLLWAEWAGLDVSCRFERADPIAEELLAIARVSDIPVAPVLGHTAYGISRWHRGAFTQAAEHLGTARAAASAVPTGTLASMLLDLDQVRLATPFSIYMHDLLGDLADPEARYEEAMRQFPGDRYWELLVCNFAASGALFTGDFPRAERAGRRGLAADPEGISAFWSMADRAYLGAALALQGDLEQGLPLLDEAWDRYRAMGLRTNGVLLLSSRAQALAEAGRLEEAEASLAEARRVLQETGERYAEPALLLAEAVLTHARGGDPAEVEGLLREAIERASRGGADAVVRRLRATGQPLGVNV